MKLSVFHLRLVSPMSLLVESVALLVMFILIGFLARQILLALVTLSPCPHRLILKPLLSLRRVVLAQIDLQILYFMNKNYKNNYKYTSNGYMLVEVLVAFSIIVICIWSFMDVAQKSISLSSRSVHSTQATFLLEEGAEAVRIVRDNAWSGISSLTNGTTYYPTFSSPNWTLSTTANTVGIFTRTVTLSAVNRNASTQDIASSGTLDPSTKLVTVTVSWSERGTTVTKTLLFYIADIFS